MNKILLALTLALLLSISVAGVANATHSNGEGPNYDFVAGSGERPVFGAPELDIRVHVDAKSGSSGEEAQGHFFATSELSNSGPLDFRGRVTCLRVTGNRATVGGVVERSTESFPTEGSGILMFVEDNGEPSDLDRNLVIFPFVPPGDRCPPVAPIGIPFAQGNFVVHDAPTTP